MTNRNNFNRTEINRGEFTSRRRPTERARAITAQKKASAKNKRIAISVVALAMVLITAGCAMAFSLANQPAANNTVTKSIGASAAPQADNQSATNPMTQAIAQVSSQTPQSDPAPAYIPDQSDDQGAYTPDQTPYTPDQSGTTAAMEIAQRVYAGCSLEQTSEPNIILVNGERVYIDTTRLIPDGAGCPDHFYANGMTSYGFDWTYSTDNANFVIRCDYNFARQQYDFQFYGVTPGIAHVTVYYNTSDGVQVPAQLTLSVDDNLNANLVQ